MTTALVVSLVIANPAFAAPAADYPTWQEVRAAQAAESSTTALIAKIRAQLEVLKAEAARTQQVADEKGAIWTTAQLAADEQALVTEELQSQVEEAEAEAAQEQARAARLLAATARTGGVDLTATLLFSADDPDSFLSALSMSNKVAENATRLFEVALRVKRGAEALADQARVAQDKLDELQEDARVAYEAARAAAAEAESKLIEQQENEARLAAQLAVLTEQRQATEADYLKGIQAQWGAGAAGIVSPSGWARPARGYITSGFGWRIPPTPGASSYHGGLDFSEANYCGSPIYAAYAGTVTYAGPNGGLGNYIQIDHGNGYVTGYAHLQNGGIGVRMNQTVGPGQHIGRAGTTGVSTGCHLHLILRKNGTAIDPLKFLQGQGVPFG